MHVSNVEEDLEILNRARIRTKALYNQFRLKNLRFRELEKRSIQLLLKRRESWENLHRTCEKIERFEENLGIKNSLPKKRRKAPGFIHGDIRRYCDPSEKRGEQSFSEQLFLFETRYMA